MGESATEAPGASDASAGVLVDVYRVTWPEGSVRLTTTPVRVEVDCENGLVVL